MARRHGWGGSPPATDEDAVARIVDAAVALIDENENSPLEVAWAKLVLGELLRSAGYDARTVSTGAAALEAVDAAPVDAVLLDLHLPDRNGRTLIGELRQRLLADDRRPRLGRQQPRRRMDHEQPALARMGV